MTRVLSVTSEFAPLIKTGGLADVAGALPGAMAPEGWDVRTILPGYPEVLRKVSRGKVVLREDDLFGGTAEVRAVKSDGQKLLILHAPHLFDRPGGPYNDPDGRDWPDNPERFAALSWMAARVADDGIGKWRPTVVHAHDWQAGWTPVYLAEYAGATRPGTVLTIHNIAFQGFAPANRRSGLRLPENGFHRDGFEFWGHLSALKAGLVWSDKVTTVSPSYARELTTEGFGMGLEGVIRARGADVVGILNGIDTEVWNPGTDENVVPYKSPGGKRRAKAALRSELGLPEAEGPLCVVVSRLSGQKGLDLLIQALPALLDAGGQLAVLGSGDRGLEHQFREAAHWHEGVAVHIGYDEAMAHRLIAGGDAIVVPSRFEPCGLTQLYGLRYGTVPIVAYTGGLIDTVIPVTPMALRSGIATGIQFHPVTADALAAALYRAAMLYRDAKLWTQLQKNGMRQSVGWEASASEYAKLYQEVARS